MFLKYVKYKEYKKNPLKLNRLWNSEYYRSFPIISRIFKDRIINDSNLDVNCSHVALYENAPVGFIFIKIWNQTSSFYENKDTAFISLMYVAKDIRKIGVGTDLLKLAIDALKVYHPNVKHISVGNEPFPIFSGLPNQLSDSTMFFLNKGFKSAEGMCDMIKIVKQVEIAELKNSDEHFKIRIATEDDRDEILKLCLDNGWAKRAYLVNRYFEHGGTGRRIVVGLVDDKIIGFYRIYDRKLNPVKINLFTDRSVGVLSLFGIDKEYKDLGYDKKLCLASQKYLINRGAKKILIENTKDIDFYMNLGFKTFKYYLTFNMDIESFKTREQNNA